jgi:receptor protein-tyrosine kinase
VSIIEQAARRLEALRQAGIEVPGAVHTKATGAAADALDSDSSQGALARGGSGARFASKVQSRRVEVDIARLAARGFVTPDSPRSELAEEFRTVKRPLLTNARGKVGAAAVARGNLIMVTSALPGEGKTFAAINLALSIAMELDSRVLLVDADVRRPCVLERLGLAQEPGLMDVLEDPERPLSRVLLQTNIEKLSLLPAGSPHGHATEYLSSERMRRLLDEMRTRYADRILIFDAPPLLPSTESRALATQMGQVVLVVAEGQTPRANVVEALAALTNCPIVLPMLNQATGQRLAAYGSYGSYDVRGSGGRAS